jgi:hypothetical protein
MTACQMTSCPRPADRLVTYNHPDPSLRWRAALCREHAHEAATIGGKGEMTYAPLTEPSLAGAAPAGSA